MSVAATKADCVGCREDHFNQRDGGECWSLKHARIVPMWRSKGRGSGRMDAVEIPHCWHQAGLFHAPRVVPPEVTR